MDNKKFSFKIINILNGTNKKGQKYHKVICYCYFDFNITFFLNDEKFSRLSALMNEKDFDINDYISVFYDNDKRQFAYIIKL